VDRLEVGKQLIAENVQSVVDINNQAVRLAQSGQLEDAVQMFMQAVEELPQNQQILLNAVNAILAMVHRKGWHETHMAHAYHFLERVRQMDPLNGKYQKLQHSYRQVIEQHSKQQWTPVLPKTEEELAAEAAAAEEAAAQAAALKANKGRPAPAPSKTVS
jgi:tetratricopeptide (TPR) repeat protein